MKPHISMVKNESQSWKGKTFQQVYASLQKNRRTATPVTIHSIRKAQPLQLYRKEVVTGNTPTSFQRHATKINTFDMPNETFIAAKKHDSSGLTATLDAKETVYAVQNEKHCMFPPSSSACVVTQQNALNRVRTSGIVKPNYNYNHSQYLQNRNKTFHQNQFNFHRAPEHGENVFAAQGAELLPCSTFFLSQPTELSYVDLFSNVHVVTIPAGNYTTADINTLLQNNMIHNRAYLLNQKTMSKTFLMALGYDSNNKKVTLTFLNNASNQFMQLKLSDTMGKILGFPAGTYPSLATNAAKSFVFSSTSVPLIGPPNFVAVSYKPNNGAFHQDAAQMSSAQTSRIVYNTITTMSEVPNKRNLSFPTRQTLKFPKYGPPILCK